jgi:Ca-activated chloride channel family protein
MGIIYFEKGEYAEAVEAFRNALKADGSRIDAKRNLELSLLTNNRNSSPQAASPQTRTENIRQGQGGSNSVLFNYLREKEQEQWKSREWTEESDFTGPDY